MVDHMNVGNEKKATVVMLGALGTLVVGTAAWKLDVFEPSSPEPVSAAAKATPQAAPPPRSDFSARRPLERFVQAAKGLHDDIDSLEDCVQKWRTDILPLRTNEAGGRIAADPARVQAMQTVLSHEHPGKDEVAQLRTTVDMLSAAVEADLADGAPYNALEPLRRTELDELKTSARQALALFQQDFQLVDSLVIASRNETPTEPLFEALAALLTKEAEQRAAILLEEQQERDAAKEAADKETQRLLELAQAPETKHLYSAFLSKGQFNSRTRGNDPGPPWPVSLANLNYHGVLSDDYLFASFACGRTCEYRAQGVHPGHGTLVFSSNDRPTAPDFPKTDAEWATWKNRREQFNELVPTFLELGLLRP